MLELKNKTTPIGLDFGSSGVRAVQLQQRGGVWEVIRIARSELAPAGDGPRQRDASELTERLRQCLRGEQFRGRVAAAALQTPDVEVHALELPAAVVTGSDSETREVVLWELSRLMKVPPEKVEVDFWLLPETKSAGPNAIGVCARRRPVLDTLALCGALGLTCSRVDAVPTALQRFALHLRRWKQRDVWGILDVGFQRSRLIVSVGAVPVLTRDVGAGGRVWTEHIADALQVSAKTAEVQKCEHGIARAGRGVRQGEDGPPAAELAGIIYQALRGHLADLAAEVKRSYEYILSRYGVAEAGDLVLVGGGACLARLDEFLAQSLGITVKCAGAYLEEPGCSLQFASAQGLRLERLAVAIGTALEEGA